MNELERHSLKVAGSTVTCVISTSSMPNSSARAAQNIVFFGEAAFDEQLMQRLTRGGEVSLENACEIGRRDGSRVESVVAPVAFPSSEERGGRRIMGGLIR